MREGKKKKRKLRKWKHICHKRGLKTDQLKYLVERKLVNEPTGPSLRKGKNPQTKKGSKPRGGPVRRKMGHIKAGKTCRPDLLKGGENACKREVTVEERLCGQEGIEGGKVSTRVRKGH